VGSVFTEASAGTSLLVGDGVGLLLFVLDDFGVVRSGSFGRVGQDWSTCGIVVESRVTIAAFEFVAGDGAASSVMAEGFNRFGCCRRCVGLCRICTIVEFLKLGGEYNH